MENNKSLEEIIEAIFDSYFYNRSTEDMIDLCKEIIDRLELVKIDVTWTPDGNIIYGILTLLYGDYGTSPRSGFFYSVELRQNMIECIRKYMNELIEEAKNE